MNDKKTILAGLRACVLQTGICGDCPYKGISSKLCAASLYADLMELITQLEDEPRLRVKLYRHIKAEINPYGRPFEGSAYEFGVSLLDYLKAGDHERVLPDQKGETDDG